MSTLYGQSVARREEQRLRRERLRRWNELRRAIGYKRSHRLLKNAKPENEIEREFVELIPLAKKRKIW